MSEHDYTTTPANELSAEYLRSVLHYDQETGIFTWKVRTAHSVKAGDVAGCRGGLGYRLIRLQSRPYKAHRLAWLYVYGSWPKDQLDHVNRNRSDNRIVNLREVTNKQNNQNKSKPNNNTSGHTGVYWHKQRSKWRACIMHNYKMIHLGYFTDIEDAVSARKVAENFTGPIPNNLATARVSGLFAGRASEYQEHNMPSAIYRSNFA